VRGTLAPGVRIRLRPVARVLPDDGEVAANPRARSAVLRVAERVAGPDADERLAEPVAGRRGRRGA